jgi:hypothetical protein
LVALAPLLLTAGDLTRVRYNNPGLTVDLGVGLWAWPLPMDYDGDGDLDLVVSSGGVPYQGTYFFENPGGSKMPVFKPGVRIADYKTNVQLSPDGSVMTPSAVYPDFKTSGFDAPQPLGIETDAFHTSQGRIRANQWKRLDYDGDGTLDLVVGIGDWVDYGWDDAYNARGELTNGPLHGSVYWARGTATGYAQPQRVEVDGKPIDVFGMPSPNLADFDGDGDLDLICGEFLDGFTYFENIGSRTAPKYAEGKRLDAHMDLQMITPVAVDWDRDGDPDLIVGDEDGRVAYIENLGDAKFADPVYFQQQAEFVKFGALVTPVSYDWDNDGDEDLIAGNSAGYIGFIENLDGGDPPKWAAPVYLDAAGERIRIQAGKNGSIQGPAEAKWGYTTLSVADWDADGLPDLIVNSIWGKVVWYRNVGTLDEPQLTAAVPVELIHPTDDNARMNPSWNWFKPDGAAFVTQWRTTPVVVDWDGKARIDLVMLDAEGYLSLFDGYTMEGHTYIEGKPDVEWPFVMGPRRIFLSDAQSVFDNKNVPQNNQAGPLRLNPDRAGKSGRRKLAIVDWDGDGRLDLLVNSKSIDWFRNLGERDGKTVLRWQGPLTDEVLAGHTTSPTTVDWDRDGVRDLLIGAEDGFLYWMKNPR